LPTRQTIVASFSESSGLIGQLDLAAISSDGRIGCPALSRAVERRRAPIHRVLSDIIRHARNPGEGSTIRLRSTRAIPKPAKRSSKSAAQ